MKILTVVARDPRHDTTNPNGDTGDIEGETDDEIKAVIERLRARTNKGSHRLMRAGSVSALAKVLGDHAKKVDLVQIVGHGRVGELWLGATWTKVPSSKSLSYVIDSMPFSHGNLRDKVPPGAFVWLLGCQVGASIDNLFVGFADGGTLVFDLARMWRRPDLQPRSVSASVDPITAANFNDEGMFDSPARLATSDGVGVIGPLGPRRTNWTRRNPVELEFLGGSPRSGITREERDPLRGASWHHVDIRHVLAAPHAEVTVRFEGEIFDGEVIAGGELLRLVRVGGRRQTIYLAPQTSLVIEPRGDWQERPQLRELIGCQAATVFHAGRDHAKRLRDRIRRRLCGALQHS